MRRKRNAGVLIRRQGEVVPQRREDRVGRHLDRPEPDGGEALVVCVLNVMSEGGVDLRKREGRASASSRIRTEEKRERRRTCSDMRSKIPTS